MTRFVQSIFLLFMGMSFMACTGNSDKLNEAGQIMESKPDSALHILNRIHLKELFSSSDKAYYALLLTQAQNKADIIIESDSLISIATNYYNEKDPVRAGYAWLYSSRCANYRGNAEVQASSLLKAQEYAQLTTDYKLQALIYCDKADMYQVQQQSDSAIILNRKGLAAFQRANDRYNTALTAFSIGYIWLRMNQNDSSLKYLHMAEKWAYVLKDAPLTNTIYKALGNYAIHQNNYQKALYYYHCSPLTHMPNLDSNTWYLIANVFIKINNTDSARYYLNKVTYARAMLPECCKLWQQLYTLEKNYPKALEYAQKASEAKDSVYRASLSQSFAGLEKKYHYEHLTLENNNLVIVNKQRRIVMLIVLLAVSIIVIVLLYWSFRTKQQQLAAQKNLREKEKALLDKAKENNELLQRQTKMQQHLLQYIEEYRLNAVKGKVTADIKISDDKMKEEILIYVDSMYNNISRRLSKEIVELTERDIYICCMLLADFNTGTIAGILNVRNDSINTHRTRLRKKLKLENNQNLIEYLRNL